MVDCVRAEVGGSVSETYAHAKRALNASAPERVVCRAKENEELQNILVGCFKENKTASLYVNGQPGTGKTLTVTSVLDSLHGKHRFKVVNINCMSIKNMQTLYKNLLQELSVGNSLDNSMNLTPRKRSTKDTASKSLEASITSSKHHIVLVLDEIDQIESTIKASADLYKIFEWPFLANSKLILIGIANALDFTDRLLPRLELKPECKPQIIKFMPYTKEDITNIVKDRLRSVQEANGVRVMEDAAIVFCASKIASTSGDIRKVLDICRRAVEMIEKDAKASGPNQPIKSVGIAHIMRILNEINPMTNANLDRATMPLMQKILLCTILLCSKDMKVRDVPLSKLFDKFNKICKAYSTQMDSESEFVNLCNLVQDNGFIQMVKSKEKQAMRTHKVMLKLDEQELRDRLQDEAFMSDILTNELYK